MLIPLLAGLGAICAMSNPPRRKRVARRRCNPAKYPAFIEWKKGRRESGWAVIYDEADRSSVSAGSDYDGTNEIFLKGDMAPAVNGVLAAGVIDEIIGGRMAVECDLNKFAAALDKDGWHYQAKRIRERHSI